MSMEILVIGGILLAVIAIGKLRDIERVNRALLLGKRAELQFSCRRHELLAALDLLRAVGHDMNSPKYRETAFEIWKIDATVADEYDPLGMTRNVDALDGRWEEWVSICTTHTLDDLLVKSRERV